MSQDSLHTLTLRLPAAVACAVDAALAQTVADTLRRLLAARQGTPTDHDAFGRRFARLAAPFDHEAWRRRLLRPLPWLQPPRSP